MRYLTLLSAAKKLKDKDLPDLPLFVEIHKFTKANEPNLFKYLVNRMADPYGWENAGAYLDKHFEEGKILVLLDGLDEAGAADDQANDPEPRMKFVLESIRDFHSCYPRTPIVITCRKAGWTAGNLDGFRVFEVLDFSQENIEAFVKNWFCPSDLPPENHAEAGQLAEKLLQNFKTKVRLRFLAANPLLLSLICNVFEPDRELPERRAELYKRCVELLLIQWDSRRGLDRRNRFTSANKTLLLSELALYFQQNRQRYFRKEVLLDQIGAYLPFIGLEPNKAPAILDEILVNQGLLEQEAENYYGFNHLTLQEYFCARALRQKNNVAEAVEILYHHVGDAWWEEVTFLYAGVDGDTAPWLEKLLGDPDDIFNTNLYLAVRCLTGNPEVRNPALRRQIIERTVAISFDENQPYLLRKDAVQALIDNGDPNLRQRLFSFFLTKLDEDLSLMRILLPVLTLPQAKEYITQLTNPQVDDGVKRSIALSLGELGEKSIAGELVALLTNPQVADYVKMSTAYSLGQIGEKSIAGGLMALLTNPHVDDDVKGSIAYSLGQIGEKSIAVELVALLTNPQVADGVKMSIASSLGQIGEKSIAVELVALLTDPQVDDDVKGKIAESLGRLGEKSIAGELVALLTNPQVADEVKWSIASSLGELIEEEKHLLQFAESYKAQSESVQKVAQELRVRLYRNDSVSPPRYYTRKIPD
jgi:NACHT domain/HEAT repeats